MRTPVRRAIRAPPTVRRRRAAPRRARSAAPGTSAGAPSGCATSPSPATASAPTCPADVGLPDGDGDGVCDAHDVCPLVADPGQEDDDGDGRGNACDPCTNVVPTTTAKAVLKMSKLLTPPGDDRLKLKAHHRGRAHAAAARSSRAGTARDPERCTRRLPDRRAPARRRVFHRREGRMEGRRHGVELRQRRSGPSVDPGHHEGVAARAHERARASTRSRSRARTAATRSRLAAFPCSSPS